MICVFWWEISLVLKCCLFFIVHSINFLIGVWWTCHSNKSTTPWSHILDPTNQHKPEQHLRPASWQRLQNLWWKFLSRTAAACCYKNTLFIFFSKNFNCCKNIHVNTSIACHLLISRCNFEKLCLKRECQQTLFGKKKQVKLFRNHHLFKKKSEGISTCVT